MTKVLISSRTCSRLSSKIQTSWGNKPMLFVNKLLISTHHQVHSDSKDSKDRLRGWDQCSPGFNRIRALILAKAHNKMPSLVHLIIQHSRGYNNNFLVNNKICLDLCLNSSNSSNSSKCGSNNRTFRCSSNFNIKNIMGKGITELSLSCCCCC